MTGPLFALLAGVVVSAPALPEETPVPGKRAGPFRACDFGAVADGRTESGGAIRAAIAAAIKAGPGAEVLLDEGTYIVKAEGPKGYCFPIDRASGLTVRGAGKATRIVIADPTCGGFNAILSKGVAIRDLSFDYDPVPFCQGTIRSVDPEAGHFDLEVDAGFPTPDAENFVKADEPYGKWGMIMDRTTRRIKAGTPDHYMTPRWEHREGRTWRFHTTEEHYRRNLRHMKEGDAYVHLARGHAGAVLMATWCEGVRFEGILVHASPALAVGLVGNRGEIAVRGLEVRFASGTARLLTTNADGVHCQQNRAGPLIEGCWFEGMADDGVNIYAPPNVLLEVRSPKRWLVSPGCIVMPGDRLQVLDPRTGRVRGDVKASGASAEGRRLLLELEAPLEGASAGRDHRDGDTLYNLDACGTGFRILRNHFNGNRRYGCMLRAGGGVVEGNTFSDTTGAGVMVTNEPDWPEGPMPWGIAIRRNRFIRGGACLGYADSPQGAALGVRAVRLGHGLAEGEGIRGITIEGSRHRSDRIRHGPASSRPRPTKLRTSPSGCSGRCPSRPGRPWISNRISGSCPPRGSVRRPRSGVRPRGRGFRRRKRSIEPWPPAARSPADVRAVTSGRALRLPSSHDRGWTYVHPMLARQAVNSQPDDDRREGPASILARSRSSLVARPARLRPVVLPPSLTSPSPLARSLMQLRPISLLEAMAGAGLGGRRALLPRQGALNSGICPDSIVSGETRPWICWAHRRISHRQRVALQAQGDGGSGRLHPRTSATGTGWFSGRRCSRSPSGSSATSRSCPPPGCAGCDGPWTGGTCRATRDRAA
jgi:hypothetical protein